MAQEEDALSATVEARVNSFFMLKPLQQQVAMVLVLLWQLVVQKGCSLTYVVNQRVH